MNHGVLYNSPFSKSAICIDSIVHVLKCFFQVPHTTSVRQCDICVGNGKILCFDCNGKGKVIWYS